MSTSVIANDEDRPAWLPIDLFPFQSRFSELDGSTVHYIDEGQGPPILFLHGNPTYSFLYRNIVLQLRDSFRCIALDYPGFGRSTAANDYTYRPREHAHVVSSFVDELGLEGATLFGQDWGGPIGLWAAGQHPERFDRFVLANTWAWPVDGDPKFERFSNLLSSRVGAAAIRNLNGFVNVMLPMGCYHRPSSRVMDAYRGPFPTAASREPTAIFPKEILASSPFLAEAEIYLEKFAHTPTLLPWGAEDPAFGQRERARFEDVLERCATCELPEASHFVQEDAPGRIAEAIRDWHPGK